MKKTNDIYTGRKMTNHKMQITNNKQIQNIKFQLVIGILVLLGIWCLGFGSLPARADGVLSDPTTIGVGARALGMGKAYVGVAEDGDAVFINPAGLARSTNPKLSSMYTSLLGDVNYTVIGGVFPYGSKSAIGAGYIGSSVDNIPLTNTTGASLGSGRWGNNVMFLSYGTFLSELGFKLDRDVLVGANVKYFSVGGSGTATIESGAGEGLNADLGLLYPVNNYIMLGANAQNILPSSTGKITHASGSADTLARTLKIGAKVTLVGEGDSALSASDNRKLYGNIDYDMPVGGNQPSVLHLGAEFWPTPTLALRAGLDGQDPTAGIGVRISGLEFNYAYHPYSGINENTTQYFSIGYLGEAKKRELKISIDEPKDKSVIYEDHVTVKGKVEEKDNDEGKPSSPLSLKINGVPVAVNPDGTFAAELPVENYGKKLIQLEALAGGTVANYDARLVRLTSFADVPEGYWAKQPIENNATVGLVEGYPDKTFRPESALTRAELATLLVRAKGIKAIGPAQKVFKDVKPGFWAAKYIEIAQREGLIKGYPDKTFRPNNRINRVEGIAVMVRFDQMKLAEVYSKPYWDIPANHWAAKYIQTAKDAGMLNFVERNRLQPKEALVRSESVDMLAKTSLAGGKIKDLYAWEKGFKPGFTPEQRPQIKAGAGEFASNQL